MAAQDVKTPSPYGYIRAKDCAYAEAAGFTWRKLPAPKKDFKDRPFTHILSIGETSFSHVLEPDTHVPNFSTDFRDALRLARDLKLDIEAERLRVMKKIDTALMGDEELGDMLD